MGSSQIAIYTNNPPSPRLPESAGSTADEVAELRRPLTEPSQSSVPRLDDRLAEIERRIKILESPGGTGESDTISVTESANDNRNAINELQTQLFAGGFSQGEYDVIASTREELQLARLQLRDRAIREGWYRSESWSQQSSALNADTALRKKLGDERFDDYLTATGRNNRVKIDDVMAGSAAQQAGIVPGDVIHRYADRLVYLSAELRDMTTAGDAGEATALTVLRDGELLDMSVPRGPLGVVISGIAISPGNQ